MTKIAILAGGCSPEHDISIQSGSQVLRHLAGHHEVWPVWLDREGSWWPAAAPVPPPRVLQGFRCAGMEPMRPGEAMAFLLDRARIDAVFPVLHGPAGEDGTVQGMMALHGVACVGSGTAASAVAMDKIRTRETLTAHGVPMPRAYVPRAPLSRADAAEEAAAIGRELGYPCFLKVDVSGSTLGVQRAAGPHDVVAFVEAHRGRGRRFLAEAETRGEEITVPVLGNSGDDLLPLPPVGIYPVVDGYFTYEAKYTASLCEEVVPPRGLDAAAIEAVQELGVRCHTALQCDGLSRVDMIVAEDGPQVLEVNTIPGLTDVSLVPRAAAAAGIDFQTLLDRLIDAALARNTAP